VKQVPEIEPSVNEVPASAGVEKIIVKHIKERSQEVKDFMQFFTNCVLAKRSIDNSSESLK